MATTIALILLSVFCLSCVYLIVVLFKKQGMLATRVIDIETDLKNTKLMHFEAFKTLSASNALMFAEMAKIQKVAVIIQNMLAEKNKSNTAAIIFEPDKHGNGSSGQSN